MIFQPFLLALAIVGPLHPVPATTKTARPVRQQMSAPVIQAQGHPMHVNFFIASSKRSDLRLAAIAKGHDAAFTDWLEREKPHVYLQYVETPAK